MLIKIIIFINFIFSSRLYDQTLGQKFMSTKKVTMINFDDRKWHNDTGNDEDSFITAGLLSTIAYKTQICNVEMIYGDNLDSKAIVYDHCGSQSILPIVDTCSSAVVSLQEFTDFITSSSDSSNFADLKEKLFNKLKNSKFDLFYFGGEVNEVMIKINRLDKSTILQTDLGKTTINKKVALNKIKKILSQSVPIHLNLSKCPIVKNTQGKKIIMFYLTFEDKIDNKKNIRLRFIK